MGVSLELRGQIGHVKCHRMVMRGRTLTHLSSSCIAKEVASIEL